MEGYMDDQMMDEEQDDNREEWMEEEEEDNYSDMSAYGDEPTKKGSDVRTSAAPPLTASQGGEVKLVIKPQMQGNPMAIKCYCSDTTPSPALTSTVDLRCAACGGFFHQRCLKNPALIRPRPLPGDWGYKFICANCSDKKTEEFSLIGKGWADIAHVTLYNLKLHAIERGQPDRVFYRFKEEICNFIDQNWESLCFEKTRTITWNNTVGGSLSTHSHTFQNGADTMASAGWWGLRSYENPFLLKLLDPTLNRYVLTVSLYPPFRSDSPTAPRRRRARRPRNRTHSHSQATSAADQSARLLWEIANLFLKALTWLNDVANLVKPLLNQ